MLRRAIVDKAPGTLVDRKQFIDAGAPAISGVIALRATGRSMQRRGRYPDLDQQGGQELASLLGGTLVASPFTTFGTQQRDPYIRMPNGQMIDASVLANSLNAARTAKDPFSATQSVLEVYKAEAASFNLGTSTDALDYVSKGLLRPGLLSALQS